MKEITKYLNSRFVICSTCDEEKKKECPLAIAKKCNGEKCTEVVDIVSLLEQADARKEIEELKNEIEKLKNEIEELKNEASFQGMMLRRLSI